ERLMEDWTAPVYAFFHPVPEIEYVKGHQSHVFKYDAKRCKHNVQCYLDTGDATSTGNLCKHIKSCWGEDVLDAVAGQTAKDAHKTVVNSILQTGTITAAFKHKGKGKVTYSHCQHTKTETSYCGFQSLMKTGCPEYYIPLPSTVSCNVKLVFAELNFATDAWTSPNHKAFVAVSVHLEHKGQPLAMILDIVEVTKSHSGVNLTEAFTRILNDFGISGKVSDQQLSTGLPAEHTIDIEHHWG
ncbi:hypothetical protein BV22DRAFT_1023794, partial [Leucogyrophana mollusca]